MPRSVELQDVELDTLAWGFLGSPYASNRFTEWPIDRRLQAYLVHHGLGDIADDGTVSAAILDRAMANIARALDRGMLKPNG
jgi:hypothetical protein